MIMNAYPGLTMIQLSMASLFLFACTVFTSSALHGGPQVLSISDIPLSEYLALHDLYTINNGKNWYWGQAPGIKWNFTAYTSNNPCADEWEGITCTSEEIDGFFHIDILNLVAYNLHGYIPSSIANLTHMSQLLLRANYFNGSTIPASIGQLSHLKQLDLGASTLLGHIPDVFDGLQSLSALYLSYNYLSGMFPHSLCEALNITDLQIRNNRLNGTIPLCIGQLTKLVNLNIGENYFNGTVPASFGLLTNMEQLNFDINSFTGYLPDVYGGMTRLQQFDGSHNYFNGTLPVSLSTCTELYVLSLDTNGFTGTIPESYNNLVNMITFYMYSNQLHGTVPEMCNSLHLTELDYDMNDLSGTLPACWGSFKNLEYISLYNNFFSGTIPESWAGMAIMSELVLTTNYLSGSLPDIFDHMPLVGFAANDNLLTGTLPAALFVSPTLEILDLSLNFFVGELPSPPVDNSSLLIVLSVAANELSGHIPADIGNYFNVVYLNLSSNFLSGTLPTSISELVSMNYMYLSENRLSGTIPDYWGSLGTLSYLYLNKNHLSGTIPPSIGDLVLLQSLNLSSNHLTGTITPTVQQLQELQVLLLQNNVLSGSLDNVFNSATQNRLVTVQLSNNQLSGTLPDELFLLPALQVFAAVGNCFTGSIPASACGSPSLSTLALDGLQSATSCQYKLFPSSLDGMVAPDLYTIRSPLTGGIPACLFQMSGLTTLHLSGNGLTGSLASDIAVSSSLTDLSLSHNKLRGRIPPAFLSRNWTSLDLSYNRFDSSLAIDVAAFDTGVSLSLEQNRLSGVVPGALQGVESISVLESNLFVCNSQRSDLPTHDSTKDKYQCGSDTLDDTVYAWIAVGCTVLTVYGVLWWQRREWITEIRMVYTWWQASELSGEFAPHSLSLLNFVELQSAVKLTVKGGAICAAYALLVLLPIYVILSSFYGTYAHTYAWTVSAAFLSGAVAFAVEDTFLMVLLVAACVAAVSLTASVPVQALRERVATMSTAEKHARRIWNVLLVYGFYIAVNFMIVLGVNIAYVVIALNQNGEALTLAQISLALFKVAFNGVCSPLLIRWTSHRVLKSSEEASTADLISIQLFVTLVNNILIPCLVVAIISPSCFYNIFNAASEVTSSFSYPGKCVQFFPHNKRFVTCNEQETLLAITNFNPPFAYSYQCSSSFITYYAPAYVIMCIIASFGIPVAQVLLQRLHSRTVKGTRWFAVLDLLLPRILKPLDTTSPPTARNVFAPYFDATQHMITLLTYVGLLLTFGAVFPPLALCFAVTIASIAAFTKLKVGRFLCQAVELDTPQYLTVVNQECEGVGSAAILARSIYMMVVFSCLFYTLFLFDTLGDAMGITRAYWVLIAVPLLPVVLYFVRSGIKLMLWSTTVNGTDRESTGTRATEMAVLEIRSPLAYD